MLDKIVRAVRGLRCCMNHAREETKVTYECRNIECGAIFEYNRESCGHHAAPNYCPDCASPAPVVHGSLEAEQVHAEHDMLITAAQADLCAS